MKGWDNRITCQIGEHLVAAEVGRRLGLMATTFAGNVPDFDLLVANELGRSIPIQVKTIRGPSWQFDVRTFLNIEIIEEVQHVRGRSNLAMPNLVCVFVHIRGSGLDEFYIFRMSDLQGHFHANYLGGRRPKNPDSTHCALWPADLSHFKDRWELISEALESPEI